MDTNVPRRLALTTEICRAVIANAHLSDKGNAMGPVFVLTHDVSGDVAACEAAARILDMPCRRVVRQTPFDGPAVLHVVTGGTETEQDARAMIDAPFGSVIVLRLPRDETLNDVARALDAHVVRGRSIMAINNPV